MEQEFKKAADEFANIRRTINLGYLFDHSDMIDAFEEGAEWQSKQSPWISVEEQYPKYEKDKKERYLVRVESGSMETKVSYTLGWLTSKYKFNVEMDWVRVTHWMPIPSFYDILEANKDVLERIKEKGD